MDGDRPSAIRPLAAVLPILVAAFVDVREQLALTNRGFEHGPAWTAGLGAFERATFYAGRRGPNCHTDSRTDNPRAESYDD